MNHEDVRNRFNEYLSQELPHAERQEVEQHLLACAECRASFDEHKEYIRLLQGTIASLNPSAEMKTSVVEMAKATPQVSRWTPGKTIAYAAAALLAFAASFWAGNRLLSDGGNPQIVTGSPLPKLESFGDVEPTVGSKLAVIDANRIRQDSGEVFYHLNKVKNAAVETPSGRVDSTGKDSSFRVSIYHGAGELEKDRRIVERQLLIPEFQNDGRPIVLIEPQSDGIQLHAESETFPLGRGKLFFTIQGSVPQELTPKIPEPQAPATGDHRTPVEGNANHVAIEGVVVEAATGKSLADETVFVSGIATADPYLPKTLNDAFKMLVQETVQTDSEGRFKLSGLSDGFYVVSALAGKNSSATISAVIFVGSALQKERKQFEPMVKLAAAAINQPSMKSYKLERGEKLQLTIPVPPAGQVEGYVRSKAGNVIANAELVAIPALPALGFDVADYLPAVEKYAGPFLRHARSNEQGKFKIRGLLGPVQIFARAEGYYFEKITTQIVEDDLEQEDIELEPIQDAVSIRGRVVTVDQKPIPQARVYLALSEDIFYSKIEPTEEIYLQERQRRTADTDKDGNFSFDSVRGFSASGWNPKRADRPTARIFATAPGFVSGWSEEKKLSNEPVKELVLELDAASAISGRVISEDDGKPIAGVRLSCVVERSKQQWFFDSWHGRQSNAKGEFKIDTAPAGAVTLYASLDGYETLRTKLTLEPGKQMSGVELRLKKAVWVIRGRVALPDGRPATQIAERSRECGEFPLTMGIYAMDVDPRTLPSRFEIATYGNNSYYPFSYCDARSADGFNDKVEFVIQSDPEWAQKTIWLAAYFNGELYHQQVVTPQDRNLVITIDPRTVAPKVCRAKIVVIDRATKLPMSPTQYSISLKTTEPVGRVARCTEGGDVELSMLQEGRYSAMIYAENSAAIRIDSIEMIAGTTTGPYRVETQPALHAKGRIEFPAGDAPLQGEQASYVSALDSEGNSIGSAVVGVDGSFDIRGLGMQSYELSFRAGEQASPVYMGTTLADLGSGSLSDLVISAKRASRVELVRSAALRKLYGRGSFRVSSASGRVVGFASFLGEYHSPIYLLPGTYKVALVSPGASKAWEKTITVTGDVSLELGE